jgi:Zn-finger nucleic acid-binding protein
MIAMTMMAMTMMIEIGIEVDGCSWCGGWWRKAGLSGMMESVRN